MRISKKSQYALRSLVCLSKTDGFLSLKSISEKEKISFDYLEKIFSKLEKDGLVKSKRGVSGGYSLAKKPEDIRIGEVLRSLEGEIALVECMGSKHCSRKKDCPTIGVWQKLQDSLEKTIDSIRLKDLIK